YTAQIQTSYTPLRQEFRESDVISPTHLQQLQLQYRHSDMSTSFLRSSRNSIFQSEIRAAHGDPDDPLLNNKNNPYNIKLSTRSISLPQKLDPHYQLQNKDIEGLTSPVSPGTITVTPLLNGSNANKKSKGLIVCVCFSLIAGIIFTLWAVTTLMPHYTNDQSSGQSINPKQQIPTT
ncbi:775_t:CDS:2, partial [Scutellospora calospora]